MSTHMPLGRTEELVVQEVADEVLVYDQRNDQAHCLSSAAARVWRACDGETSIFDLGPELGLDSNTVALALDELESCGLLESDSAADGMTRRQATAKMAKVGAAAAGVAVSAPLIYSIVTPTPALAASQAFCLQIGCVATTSGNSQTGCGACHNCGCACCGPGNSTSGGADKLCTADCTTTNCNLALYSARCNSAVTSVACNQPGGGGSTGPGNCLRGPFPTGPTGPTLITGPTGPTK